MMKRSRRVVTSMLLAALIWWAQDSAFAQYPSKRINLVE
jgi:hypothetical protein